MGVAIWLEPPPGELHTILSETMDRLPSVVPAFHDSPRFRAHMTVTSSLTPEHAARPAEVLAELRAFLATASTDIPANARVTLAASTPQYGGKFFNKVYLPVASDAPLVALAQFARSHYLAAPASTPEAVAQWLESGFLPHFSLLYNEKPIDDELDVDIKRETAELTALLSSSDDARSWRLQDSVLSIVVCEGPIETWKTIATSHPEK
ncbi:hypothetical protein DV454_000112 [Geotrichum candidum]|nr:hypothetical protein DV454_000112 [Geotrichum candidum]